MRNRSGLLAEGVVVDPHVPGYLALTKDSMERIVLRDSIERFYDVEEKPFARGKSAVVRRCRDLKSGRQYAAKFLKRRKSPDMKPEILHEVAVLEACRGCTRVVSLHQVFESSTEIVLVLELACGGELQTLLDTDDELPSEAQVVRLMRQILEGIVYLHNINVAHLDLKPQNLVLTGEYPNYDVKLCDFGISRYLSQNADVREILGTPDYVAPEVLNYDPISLATDMWSVGVLMYVLLTGCSPFGGDTKQETFSNITQCRLDFPEELFEEISQEAQDLMTKLMVKEPSDRLSAAECLKHPWFAKEFSESMTLVPSTPVSTTPVQRTPVPARKEQKNVRNLEEQRTTETLLPTPEENDNFTRTEVIVERKSSLTSVARLDNNKVTRLEIVEPLDNAPKAEKQTYNNTLKEERKMYRTESMRKRASANQTMPVRCFQNINRAADIGPVRYRQIFITEDMDDSSPPTSITGSSSGSSISSGHCSDSYISSSDTNSDTVSDMSIDSSSDRSSIISLDDSLDFGKSHMLRSYASCYNVWEATRNQMRPMMRPRQCSENFIRMRSVFSNRAEDGKINFRNKLTVFDSNFKNKKTVALELKKEHCNSNIVTITEVKPVTGKKYVRTTEVKCETVQSRIRKLKVYAENKTDSSKDLNVLGLNVF